QAPAVARPQAGEAERRHRRGQVVAHLRAEGEELGGQAGADGVRAAVLRRRLAAAGAEEACHRPVAARRQRAAQDVALFCHAYSCNASRTGSAKPGMMSGTVNVSFSSYVFAGTPWRYSMTL